MNKPILFSIVFLFLLADIAYAHHPVVETGFGRTGPIRTVSGSTLTKGKAAFSFQFEHSNFDPFSAEELLAFARQGEDVHSMDFVSQTFITLSYGITDDLTLSLKLPYVHFDHIRESHADEPGEVHMHGDAEGIGDVSLFGQYRFFDMNALEASFLFGLKAPTGRTDDRNHLDDRFEAEFQPGSGSWDPFFGVAAQRSFDNFGLYSSLLYTVATEGDQDTDLGDAFSYNAALSYTPIRDRLKLDLIMEVNGEFKQKQEQSGVKDPNSGGNTVLLSPGMRAIWDNRWCAFFSIGFPIIQDLNGIQNDLEYRLLSGISLAF